MMEELKDAGSVVVSCFRSKGTTFALQLPTTITATLVTYMYAGLLAKKFKVAEICEVEKRI